MECRTQNYYLGISTINKIEPLYTKEDNMHLINLQRERKKFADSCEIYKLNCLQEPFEDQPIYNGGINKFRELVYKNIDHTKIKKPSKASIRFILEKKDKIEDIIIKSENSEMRKEIFRVMNLSEIKNKNWQSGKIGNKKVMYLFEFDIEFNGKNKAN